MVEVNFVDDFDNVVLNLPDLNAIKGLFGATINYNNAQSFIMDMMTNHSRYTLGGVEYYYENVHISNTNGTIDVRYKPLNLPK